MFKQPVFIVGVPRSGTTLLQSILCHSGQYFPIPETHFFSRVAFGVPEKKINNAQKKKMLRILKRKSKIDLDETELLRLNSKKEIFEYIVGCYNKENLSTFLEKTPRHIFHYSEIMNYYSDARFICMIREPRNTVTSILSMHPDKKKSVTRIALLYNKIADRILSISQNRNVFVIRYEDLVNEPEMTVSNVCNHLQIPYDQKLLEDVAAPHTLISSHEQWKDKNIHLKTIQKNNKESWKKFFNNNSGDMVIFITRSYAPRFGYDISYNWRRVCNGFLQDIRYNLSSKEINSIFKFNRMK
jgi:hypothetical protein